MHGYRDSLPGGDCRLLCAQVAGYSTDHIHLLVLAVKQCSLKKVEDQLLSI